MRKGFLVAYIRQEKLNEVRMLLRVKDFPYCLSIKDAWIQYGYIYIQTELCSKGRFVLF
jgi:hypothetical protein